MTGISEYPVDYLAHYGKKGMKWGVRKDDTSAVKRTSPTNTEIQSARARVGSNQRMINQQIDKVNLSSGKTQAREAKKLADMSAEFLRNPDRATALRMTSGEKFAAVLLAGAIPGLGTAGVAANVGARVAARKAIEKQQRELGVVR